MKRYDNKLYKVSEKVWNNKSIDLSQFQVECDTETNICFYNKTRKRINQKYNKKMGYFIKANQKDPYTQDMYVYEGLPVIARQTIQRGKVAMNNEQFVVNRVDNEGILIKNDRITIRIDIDKFQKLFAMAYCITTHKSQGDTIKSKFTIYDWNAMDRHLKYTSITRGVNSNNIQIDNSDTRTKLDGVGSRLIGYRKQDL